VDGRRGVDVTARTEWVGRRGPLVAEVTVLAVLAVADSVFVVRAGGGSGWAAGLANAIAPGVGPAAAVLAVLRRRFADRIATLAAGVVALSLLGSVVVVLVLLTGAHLPVQPDVTETVAIALLTGAVAHHLAPRPAVALVAISGLLMASAPVLRNGVGSPLALLAVPATLLWGGAIAVGLMLRDADNRRTTALAELRTDERLRLARELHDLVAHHITGVVVRAQAARLVAGGGRIATDEDDVDDDVFADIERAGADALAAMRRMVGMLRTDGSEPHPIASTSVAEAVRGAVPENGGVVVELRDGVDTLSVPPELATTVHRVLLEALTNVRRHAPRATVVRVDLSRAADGALVVDVGNDGVHAPTNDRDRGYGLVGMRERVTALGGTLRAGPAADRRWRVRARIPLDETTSVPPGARGPSATGTVSGTQGGEGAR
jgi:signal transduction histidine kinase